MKVLFFGTPVVAVPFLKWLHQEHTVVGLVCQPDRPVGRGYEVTSPPTKIFAEQNFIPTFQPEGPWTDKTISDLKQLGAEVGVAVAYGRIMPRAVFTAPTLGTVNVHFSLLPKYRGAAPMQWALINGEKESGVTIFWLEEGMDTGPVAQQKSLAVSQEEDAMTLKEKLIRDGVVSLQRFFKDLGENKVVKEPQQGTPSMAPLLKKEDGKIIWTGSAEKIHNQVRGVVEWPGAFTQFTVEKKERKLKIFKTVVIPKTASSHEPGSIINADTTGVIVQTGQGQLLLREVQPDGKNKMPATDFWKGSRLKVGDKFF